MMSPGNLTSKSIAASCLLIAATLSGCQTMSERAPSGLETRSNMIVATNTAGDQLASFAPDSGLSTQSRLIVTTFVDGDNLRKSTSFGRAIAEQIGGRLAQRGFPIKEIRLRGSVLVRNDQGEMLLSREIGDLGREHQADAAVVGTYTEGAEYVYVSAKLIRLSDGHVVSAYNFRLLRSLDVAGLLYGIAPQQPVTPPRPPRSSREGDNSDDKSLMKHLREGSDRPMIDIIRDYDQERGPVNR